MRKILILLFLLGVLNSGAATTYTNVVVFGDSLSDSGNAYNAGLNTALVSPNYATGKYTNGSSTSPSTSINGVWSEQFATKLGVALTASTIGGSNYSYGGATTDTTSSGAPGMNNQVSSYLAAHSSLSSSTVYSVWGGSNDILISIAYGQNGLSAEASAVANIKSQIASLANAGATTVMWFNLPDLSLTPYADSLSAAAQTALHNASLQFSVDWAAAIADLEATHANLNIVAVDIYSLFNSVTTDSSAYGLANATDSAQGKSVNADEYLFWDSLHPTTAADSIIASLAYDDLLAVPEPGTVVLLVMGLLPLLVCRRVPRRCS